MIVIASQGQWIVDPLINQQVLVQIPHSLKLFII